MGPGRIEQPERGSPGPEVGAAIKTEYLDLDNDGVPDAVETRETRKYPNPDGADVVEEIRELDSGIGRSNHGHGDRRGHDRHRS